MRYTIGRFLQGFALFLLPISIFWELNGFLSRRYGVSLMLSLMLGGVFLFLLGKLIQGPKPS